MIKALIDAGANWAWSNNPNPEVSPEECLEHFFPIPPTACIIAVALKAVGIAIIAGACLNKAPIVMNILKNKSVAGMSTGSVYSETIMYANAASYSLLRGNPFTAWGENGILTVQCLLLAVLLWYYKDDPKISMVQRSVAAAGFGLYLFIVFGVLTADQYYLLMSVNMPVLLYSRGTQIHTFYSCKHTGTMSMITTGMNLMGSAIRLVTTVGEVGYDWAILSGYLISMVLNSTLMMQFVTYKEGTEKYLTSLNEKKKD